MDQTALNEIKQRATKAQQTVTNLCNRKIAWTMHVPARPESDPDLVISDSLKDVGPLVGEVERLAAVIEQVRNEIDNFIINENLDVTDHWEELTEGTLPRLADLCRSAVPYSNPGPEL